MRPKPQIPGPRPPLQFEDMYGNKVDDWHGHVRDVLNDPGGQKKWEIS